MTSSDAVYVLAHQQGVDIGKHLDSETLARISGYISRMGPPVAGRGQKALSRVTKVNKVVRVTIAGVGVDQLPGLSEAHAKEAKVMAEKVFPALYVFENSARDLITRVLSAGVGSDWWDQVVPTDVRRKAADRITKEEKESWHSARGSHPIQYIDLPDLASIITAPKAWPFFENIFPRQNWVTGVFDDLNVSRRVVAHMNPLPDAEIKQVEAGFQRWARQLRAKEAELA